MKEGSNEWMSAGMSELPNDWMIEWLHDWMTEWTNAWMKYWMNEQMTEWRDECVDQLMICIEPMSKTRTCWQQVNIGKRVVDYSLRVFPILNLARFSTHSEVFLFRYNVFAFPRWDSQSEDSHGKTARKRTLIGSSSHQGIWKEIVPGKYYLD